MHQSRGATDVLLRLVLWVASGLLLSGGMILSIHLSGHAKPKTTSLSVGVAYVVGAIAMAIFPIYSLRQAARRAQRDRLLAAGLFELPGDASERLVRLNAQLATHFGLSRQDLAAPLPCDDAVLEYASRIGTLPPRAPWPATLGDLRDAIYPGVERAHLLGGEQSDARQAIADALAKPAGGVRFITTMRIPLARFLAARHALADALGRLPEHLRWSDRLPVLIPAGRRRSAVWQRLCAQAPDLPELKLNPWIETPAICLFLAALIAIAVSIAQSLDRSDPTRLAKPGFLVLIVAPIVCLFLFAAIIAVLMIPVYAIGRRHAARLPSQFDTVASLAPWFSARDGEHPWTRADVEDHVRDLVATALKRRPGEIDAATSLAI